MDPAALQGVPLQAVMGAGCHPGIVRTQSSLCKHGGEAEHWSSSGAVREGQSRGSGSGHILGKGRVTLGV